MYIVNVHSIIIFPSGSVLVGKTMEASYTVGSFPCQYSQISLTDIPVWDKVWEQRTSRHLCSSWRVAHSKFSDFTEWSNENPFVQGFHGSHNYLSQQVGVRSCKTSQCGSVNRPSVVPHGSPRVLVPSESLQFSLTAVSVCRHDLPPHTVQWIPLTWSCQRMVGGQSLVSLLSPLTRTLHTGSCDEHCMHSKSQKHGFHILTLNLLGVGFKDRLT